MGIFHVTFDFELNGEFTFSNGENHFDADWQAEDIVLGKLEQELRENFDKYVRVKFDPDGTDADYDCEGEPWTNPNE